MGKIMIAIGALMIAAGIFFYTQGGFSHKETDTVDLGIVKADVTHNKRESVPPAVAIGLGVVGLGLAGFGFMKR